MNKSLKSIKHKMLPSSMRVAYKQNNMKILINFCIKIIAIIVFAVIYVFLIGLSIMLWNKRYLDFDEVMYFAWGYYKK